VTNKPNETNQVP